MFDKKTLQAIRHRGRHIGSARVFKKCPVAGPVSSKRRKLCPHKIQIEFHILSHSLENVA